MSEQRYCFRGKQPCGCVIYLMADYQSSLHRTNEDAMIVRLMRGGVLFDYIPMEKDSPLSFTRCERHAIGAGPGRAMLDCGMPLRTCSRR